MSLEFWRLFARGLSASRCRKLALAYAVQSHLFSQCFERLQDFVLPGLSVHFPLQLASGEERANILTRHGVAKNSISGLSQPHPKCNYLTFGLEALWPERGQTSVSYRTANREQRYRRSKFGRAFLNGVLLRCASSAQV